MDAFEEALKMVEAIKRKRLLEDFRRIISETAEADAATRQPDQKVEE